MIVFEAAALFVDLVNAVLWWAQAIASAAVFVLAVIVGTLALQPPRPRRAAWARRGTPHCPSCASPATAPPPRQPHRRTGPRQPLPTHTTWGRP